MVNHMEQCINAEAGDAPLKKREIAQQQQPSMGLIERACDKQTHQEFQIAIVSCGLAR
jgi:hypothetical protein